MNASRIKKREPSAPAPTEADFIRTARHDIRSSIHVVIGMSKILALSGANSPPPQEVIDMLRRNADRTLELIDGMFDFLLSANDCRQTSASSQLPSLKNDRSGAYVGLETLLPTAAGLSSALPRALLVEDSAASAMITAHFLKTLKYSCDVAKNGTEAMDKFSRNSYDVVIMDIQIPDIDGLETTRLIRALEKNRNVAQTPVLAVTGNATKDDRLFCLKAGMNDYLTKPFEVHDLEKKLNSILKNASAAFAKPVTGDKK